MKALEILKAFSSRHESAYGFNNIIVASLGDIKEAVEELTSMEQRIVELEEIANGRHELILKLSKQIQELSTPRTCEGCKYFLEDSNKYSVWTECRLKDSQLEYTAVPSNFGCINYEPKGQK